MQKWMCRMQAAAIVLAVAVLGGLTLAGIRLSGKPRPPTWMALGHGVVAASGLILLLVSAALGPGIPQLAQVALGILVVAALGGTGIFLGFHLRERPLPIPLVLGHGLLALVGYTVLLMSLFRDG